MELQEFNQLDRAAATETIRPCVDLDRWVDAVVAGRPYSSVAEVVQSALSAAPDWSVSEIDQALSAHPRIGDRAKGQSAEAKMSHAEQSGIDRDSEDLATALAEGNRAYEERFARVFLVRAAGRSANEILELLRVRLTHTPEVEIGVVAEQLREIAVLRLKGLFTS